VRSHLRSAARRRARAGLSAAKREVARHAKRPHGNTTIPRHLLAPRIESDEAIAVEAINADEGQAHALRGKQLGKLQD
jgi:hypothetical protein